MLIKVDFLQVCFLSFDCISTCHLFVARIVLQTYETFEVLGSNFMDVIRKQRVGVPTSPTRSATVGRRNRSVGVNS